MPQDQNTDTNIDLEEKTGLEENSDLLGYAAEAKTKSAKSAQGPIRPVPYAVRKLVVVVDDSPESKIAIRFAAARASHLTGGGLVLFHCIPPVEFQHWVAVADQMRQEAHEEATILLNKVAEELRQYSGVDPEIEIIEGEPGQTLFDYMRTTPDLFSLVLGVGTGKDPGPLVDYFTRQHTHDMPCPVFLIPGSMTYEQIDSIA